MTRIASQAPGRHHPNPGDPPVSCLPSLILHGALLTTAGIPGGLVAAARGFLNRVAAIAPPVISYLVEHGMQVRLDRFTGRVTGAARPARRAAGRLPAGPLTAAEERIVKLLPAGIHLRMAFVSRVTR